MKKAFIAIVFVSIFLLNVQPIGAKTYINPSKTEIQPRFFLNLETSMIASNSNKVDVRVKYVLEDGYGQIQKVTSISELSYFDAEYLATNAVVTDYTFTNNRKKCTVKFTYRLYAPFSSSYKTISDSVTFNAP